MKPDICPACGALPCDWTHNPARRWRPIGTMPPGKWVRVFVPGAGPESVAIRKPPFGFWGDRIVSFHSGKEIVRATHWQPLSFPPDAQFASEHNFYGDEFA